MNSDLGIQNYNPLVDPSPAEVKLEDAPLFLVVTQLRFAPITKIEDQSYIAAFQEQVRGEYPLLFPERTTFSMTFGAPLPPNSVNTRTVWRMTSLDGLWRLILGQDFIALETSAYLTREDFLGRWGRILAAFSENFHGVMGLRYGLRYVNRISNPEALARLPELVRREALGVTALLPNPALSIAEVVYPIPEGSMVARWGSLPGNATHDPSIAAVPTPSWVLDYDLFVDNSQTGKTISVQDVAQKADEFCRRGYSFFRWMTTAAFLEAHGGRP